MESKKYDVIIVGGGEGALACGSLLAKDGLKVLMLEKNNVTGGRYGSSSHDGFTLNNFSGLFFPQNLFKLLPRLGVDIPWTEVKMHCYFKTDSGEFYQPKSLAFDKKGNRIGHGQGYFDRFLKKLPSKTPTIGLAFKLQLVKKIHAFPWDIPVTKLITA